MAIRKCTTCGKMTSDSNGRCDYCGEELHDPVTCPKCGSQNVGIEFKKKSDGLIAVLTTAFFGIGLLWTFLMSKIFSNKYKIKYKCNDCGKKFRLKK